MSIITLILAFILGYCLVNIIVIWTLTLWLARSKPDYFVEVGPRIIITVWWVVYYDFYVSDKSPYLYYGATVKNHGTGFDQINWEPTPKKSFRFSSQAQAIWFRNRISEVYPDYNFQVGQISLQKKRNFFAYWLIDRHLEWAFHTCLSIFPSRNL